ncbi:MAG: glutaredoxin family protein [Bacillaceae bacterium]
MKIDVYTQPNCPPCQWVKALLQDKNITYTEYNIQKDMNARKRLLTQYECYSTPTVIINEGEHILTGDTISSLETLL